MIILDLDNCISDDSWRLDRIRWDYTDPNKRYETYHKLSVFDEFRLAEPIARHIAAGHAFVVFTGRPEFMRDATCEWLKRSLKSQIQGFAGLYMRPDGCWLSSVDLKQDMLRNLCREHRIVTSEIDHAYDDREDILKMYDSCGIPTTRVAIHNLDAYTAPGLRSEFRKKSNWSMI